MITCLPYWEAGEALIPVALSTVANPVGGSSQKILLESASECVSVYYRCRRVNV